jgi:hypothetical protein
VSGDVDGFVDRELLFEWAELPYLLGAFPSVLAGDVPPPPELAAAIAHAWSCPRTLEACAEEYVRRGELSAARWIARQLAPAPSRVLEARCDEALAEAGRRLDEERNRVLADAETLAAAGVPRGPLDGAVAESLRLERQERPGPAFELLAATRRQIDALGAERRALLRAEFTAAMAGEAAGDARHDLLASALRFLERGDLLNAMTAWQKASGPGGGEEFSDEVHHLVQRSQRPAPATLLRELPRDLPLPASLGQVHGWIQETGGALARGAAKTPEEFQALWLRIGPTSDARRRFVEQAAVALHNATTGKGRTAAQMRTVAGNVLKALVPLAGVAVEEKKLRAVAPYDSEVWRAPMTFRTPRFGPAEVMERQAIEAFLVLLARPEDVFPVLVGEIADLSAGGRLSVVLTPALGSELQQRCRQALPHLAVVDAAAFLRVLLSPDTEAAFFREIMQQVDPGWISPYREKDAVSGFMFRGRELELRHFRGNDKSFVVYGGRMVGKTSLLVRAAEELRSEKWVVVERSCEHLRERDAKAVDPLDVCSELLEGLTGQSVLLRRQADFYTAVEDYLEAHRDAKVAFFVDEVDYFLTGDRDGQYPTCGMFKELATGPGHLRGRVRFVFAGFKRLLDAVVSGETPLTRFAEAVRLGPLDEAAAHDLVRVPLELMGIVFPAGQEGNLLARILNHTSNHPSLIQRFCALLIKRVARRSEEPPRLITETDIEQIYRSEEYRQHVIYVHQLNYDLVQELIVCLAVSLKKETLSTVDVRSALLDWLPDHDGRWARHLTPSRVGTWLHELRVLRVLDEDRANRRVYRFALGTYPKILAEDRRIDDYTEALVERLAKVPPDDDAHSGGDRAPSNLLHFSLILRDCDAHQIIVGLPGSGRTMALERVRAALDDATREFFSIGAPDAPSFVMLRREVATSMGLKKDGATEIQRRALARKAAGLGQLVLLLDEPALVLEQPEQAEQLLAFLARLRAETGGAARAFLTGGPSLLRAWREYRERHAADAEGFRVSFLGRFTPRDLVSLLGARLGAGGFEAPAALRDRLQRVTGGHPAVAQALLDRIHAGQSVDDVGAALDQLDRELAPGSAELQPLREQLVERMDRRQRCALRLLVEASDRHGPRPAARILDLLVASPTARGRERLVETLVEELDLLHNCGQAERKVDSYSVGADDPVARMLRADPFDPHEILAGLRR